MCAITLDLVTSQISNILLSYLDTCSIERPLINLVLYWLVNTLAYELGHSISLLLNWLYAKVLLVVVGFVHFLLSEVIRHSP